MAQVTPGDVQIDNVMKEERCFLPPGGFAGKARIDSIEAYETLCNEAAADLEGFWGRAGRRAALVPPLRPGAPVGRAAGPMVRRRADQRVLQLSRRATWARRSRTRPP